MTMPAYWCVNFQSDENLDYGIKKNFWAMGYQYSNEDPSWRRGVITKNWRRLEEVDVGHKFVAYQKA